MAQAREEGNRAINEQCGALSSRVAQERQESTTEMASQVRAPNIDISAVVLQPAVRANLIKFGFKMTSDFFGLQPSQLARGPVLVLVRAHLCTRRPAGRFTDSGLIAEAHISNRDAADVLRAINNGPTVRFGGRSALELLQVFILCFLPRRHQPSAAQAVRSRVALPSWTLTQLSLFRLKQALDGNKHIITFCSDMDTMLGGGIPLGEVTEFCGAPGKCMFASLHVLKLP